MLRGRAQAGAPWDLYTDREQESMNFCRNDCLVCPLLRLTQDPRSFPLGKLESFIHTTLLEIRDLRINTSSSPASLLTFNMIAESLFQCCVAQGWRGTALAGLNWKLQGNPSGPPCLSSNCCSWRALTPSNLTNPCNFLFCACATARKCWTS